MNIPNYKIDLVIKEKKGKKYYNGWYCWENYDTIQRYVEL